MLGVLLNMSHYVCPSCHTPHTLFGPSASVEQATEQMGLQLLGKLPVVSQLSWSADRGVPLMLQGNYDEEVEDSVKEAKQVFNDLASLVLRRIQ
jgi:ATP-binding protein involved in chromosome partitioning